MRCEIIVDPKSEEKVLIYSKCHTPLLEAIKQLVEEYSQELIGYKEKEIVSLNLSNVYCFSIADNKVYAICKKEKFYLKERLYNIEERLNDSFIKINQSCIVNKHKIERFDSSISGTLKVILKNGYTDYVSRRQLKHVKERMGI